MRTRLCRWALLATGVALLSVNLAAQSAWSELRGNDFVVRGQLSIEKLSAVACDVETAVGVLRPARTVSDTIPAIIAVDSARGIREWLPQFNDRGRGNPLGAYWHGLYGDHIVVRIDAAPAERRRRVLHEYAHYVTHLTNPEPRPWLDEGISEIWEHTAISADAIEVGGPVSEHLKRLKAAKGWIPVSELLAANAIPTRTDATWEMFYAESWALVHYLTFEKGSGRLAFPKVSDHSEYPTDAELQQYARGQLGKAVKISTPPAAGCQSQTSFRVISRFQSLVDQAKALADGERPDSALPLLREADAIASENSEVIETIGFIHFSRNRPVEAARVFDRLIAEGKASFISYYYRALLSGPVPETSGGGPRISEVAYLQKALALNPGFRPAAERLRELTGKRLVLAAGAPTVRK